MVQDVGVAGFTMRALLLVVISCVAGRVLFALVERHFVSIRRASRHAPVPGALTQRREAPAVQP